MCVFKGKFGVYKIRHFYNVFTNKGDILQHKEGLITTTTTDRYCLLGLRYYILTQNAALSISTGNF